MLEDAQQVAARQASKKPPRTYTDHRRMPAEKDLERHVAPAIRAHMRDLLGGIASRGRPVADIEEGYMSTTACILANLSLRLGRAIEWDHPRGVVVGDSTPIRLPAEPDRARRNRCTGRFRAGGAPAARNVQDRGREGRRLVMRFGRKPESTAEKLARATGKLAGTAVRTGRKTAAAMTVAGRATRRTATSVADAMSRTRQAARRAVARRKA